jgi:subtilisin family serine protease
MSLFSKWPWSLLRGRREVVRARRTPLKVRLALEHLEDRVVPSTSHVTALSETAWRNTRYTVGDAAVRDQAFVNPAPVQGQWMQGDTLIGVDRAQANYSYRGDGYSVAIIDTGIDYNNPALGGGWGNRVIAGWDFANNDADPMDDNGHGTHVAGIIGSSDATYPGVAPNVNFIALKVLDANGSGSFGNIQDALDWVVAHQQQYNIVAINMSLGTGNFTSNPYTFLDNEFSELDNEGVFIAVASGNSFYSVKSQQGLAYPASDAYTVSVGAVWAGNFGRVAWQDGAVDFTTAADQITSFTQRSSWLDILAPGALITSTYLHNTFQTMAGTSMATPFVAGSAVLLHQALDANGFVLPSGATYEDYILATMQSTGVTVVDNNDAADNVVNTGLSFKRLDLAAALQAVSVPAPILSPIVNQSVKGGTGPVVVTLSATSPTNNPITYSATATGNAVLSVSGNTLTVAPNTGYVGTFTVTVTAYDGQRSMPQSFTVTVTDGAPILDPLADLTLPHNHGSISVPLSASDPDGDPLSFSAQVQGYSQAYQLRQQYGFLNPGSNYYFNTRGLSEKYLQGANGQWFYLLPTGALYIWGGSIASSTVLGASSNWWSDPSLLWNAAAPLPVPATIGLSGNVLTVATANGYLGTFQVYVYVSDGWLTTTRSFLVNVPDNPPVLDPVADQAMTHLQGSLTLALSGNDPDGDSLTYSARVLGYSQAYQLQQQWSLFSPGNNYYFNSRGLAEKYLQGANAQWFYLLPTGALYQWGGSLPSSTLLATNTAWWSDPSLLWRAAAPTAPTAGVSVNGNQLTILAGGTAGTFQVSVTATSGAASATRTFLVSVANNAPTLDTVADQTISHALGSFTLGLSGHDADGDNLMYAAQVQGYSQAYQLDQQFGLLNPGHNYYFSARGQSEKYLQGVNNQWFYIMPSGALYLWGGSMASSTLLATSSGWWNDPSLLWNAAAPASVPASAGVSGNQLTLISPASFIGTFQVVVTVSDGSLSATRSLFVTTTDASAPVLDAIADQSISSQATLTLPGRDADGDAVSYSAQAFVYSQALQLQQQYGLTNPGNNFYFNTRGLGEKYLLGAGNQWFYLVSGGNFYQWGGSIAASTWVATLNPTYWFDPSPLCNSSTQSSAPVGLTLNGNQLTLAPGGFTGTLLMTVSASDGALSATRSFVVTVTAPAPVPSVGPVLDAIADQHLRLNQGSLNVNLSASDSNGQALTFSVQTMSAVNAVYQLNQQYGFSFVGNYFTNNWGLGEKWLLASNNQWYLLLPNGELRLPGTSINDTLTANHLVAAVPTAVYADPSLLWNAANQFPQVTYQMYGTQLTINAPLNFAGTFVVQVTVSNGSQSVTRSFTVMVG